MYNCFVCSGQKTIKLTRKNSLNLARKKCQIGLDLHCIFSTWIALGDIQDMPLSDNVGQGGDETLVSSLSLYTGCVSLLCELRPLNYVPRSCFTFTSVFSGWCSSPFPSTPV